MPPGRLSPVQLACELARHVRTLGFAQMLSDLDLAAMRTQRKPAAVRFTHHLGPVTVELEAHDVAPLLHFTAMLSPCIVIRSKSPACLSMYRNARYSTSISRPAKGIIGHAPSSTENASAMPSETVRMKLKTKSRPEEERELFRRAV